MLPPSSASQVLPYLQVSPLDHYAPLPCVLRATYTSLLIIFILNFDIRIQTFAT